MNIAKNVVVGISYTLKDDDGKILDRSEDSPLYYLHGHGNLVAGLEEALEGQGVGSQLAVSVPPEKGYGVRSEDRVLEVSKGDFDTNVPLQKGARLSMNQNGRNVPVRITQVKLKTVTIDANHELADKTLHFEVVVESTRKATKDELTHGHAHGPDGHHHHH